MINLLFAVDLDTAGTVCLHPADTGQAVPGENGTGLQPLVEHTGGEVGGHRRSGSDDAQFQFAVSITYGLNFGSLSSQKKLMLCILTDPN